MRRKEESFPGMTGEDRSFLEGKERRSAGYPQGFGGGVVQEDFLQTTSGTKQILADFRGRDRKRILLLCLVQFPLIGYLVWYGRLSAYLLLCPVACCLLAFGWFRATGARNFFRVYDSLPFSCQEALKKAYGQAHPVCRLFFGEVHLLPGFLIYRSRGKLGLIPLGDVEKIRRLSHASARGVTQSLVLVLKSGKRYELEFWAKDQKEFSKVVSFLQEQNEEIRQEA